MSSGTADLLWKLWYPLLTGLTRGAPIVFLNYGYADAEASRAPALSGQDEADRPCVQLYDCVVRPVDLRGRSVLEVSCGHGGGASYVARSRLPRVMHAVDRNPRAVALCRRRHNVPGLSFSRGDALALNFADATFDAVVNVEASHCYPDAPRFFREVARVLRPGGHLLYADFRTAGPDADALHRHLTDSGLELVEREDLSAGVVRGMRLNTPKYLAWIGQFVPRFLRKPAMRFAGVEGSAIHGELVSGKTVYLRYVLRKRG